MPIRNPFRRTAGGLDSIEDNGRDQTARQENGGIVEGAKPVDIAEPTEYKLSGMGYSTRHSRSCDRAAQLGILANTMAEINNSGVYLPV